MGRFIDDENFLALFDGVDLADTLPVGTIKILLHGVPTADVKPVVHAHWIEECDDLICSNCETRYSDDIIFAIRSITFEYCPYCPHCGAKMDEEDDHEQ